MVIEVNKDIDRYQESVAMGLSAKQLIFSAVSLICGAGLILFLYRYIGLTASAYVAIPVVAPIALGGFYSYHGMGFYEVMGRKFHFTFVNKALVYVSTEGEAVIQEYRQKLMKKEQCRYGFFKKQKNPSTVKADNVKKKEDFEDMKKKTRKMIIGCIITFVIAVAGAFVYKNTR